MQDAIVFLCFILAGLAALASFSYGWDRWSLAAPAPGSRNWRHRAGGVACIAVAAQGLNLVAFLLIAFSRLIDDTELLRLWVVSPLLFILGVIFILGSAGSARWYLLLSSVLFLGLSFFTTLGLLGSVNATVFFDSYW